jgi:ABC-type antimicrobial peptide transport system permease subunit
MSPEGIFEIGLKLSSKAFRGAAVKVFQHTHLLFHTIFMQPSSRILCLIRRRVEDVNEVDKHFIRINKG